MTPYDNEEENNLTKRVYRLSDTQQEQDRKLVEHHTLLENIKIQLNIIATTMVNRDLLNVTVGTVVSKMESLQRENDLKLTNIDQKLEPIRKGINWAVIVIVGAVLSALLTLVIIRP